MLPRLRVLDAARGLTALGVVFYHCSSTLLTLPPGAAADWFVNAVVVFFTISGYSVFLVTLKRADTAPAFLWRRWTRTYVPYWASLVVTIGVAIAALPFNRGHVADFLLPPGAWPWIVTLTQSFTQYANALNPVYWTLGYEEQFYLVMAAAVLLASRRRPAFVAAVSLVAAVYILPAAEPYRISGLFLRYWLEFAAGAAAAIWLHDRSHRAWAAGIAGVALVALGLTQSVSLAISVILAAACVLVAPFDHRIARVRLLSPLFWCGNISYSLYLIHAPVGGRVVNLAARWHWPAWGIIAAGVTAALAAGALFHAGVERPLRERLIRSQSPRGSSPDGALLVPPC
jgi:peptidoglycan/LPS O-acetylase OafA/YrhL